MHEVDVFGQRLAQRLGHRLDATVGHEPTTDLRLDLLAELIDADLVLVALEPLLELRHVREPVARLVHQPLEHRVEVEVPQRAVQVVRAADRAAGLHAGVAPHGLAGDGAHQRVVAFHQRAVQQLGQLLGRHRLAAAGALHAFGALLAHLLEQVVEIAEVELFAVLADGVLLAPQREVDLEHRLERAPVRCSSRAWPPART